MPRGGKVDKAAKPPARRTSTSANGDTPKTAKVKLPQSSGTGKNNNMDDFVHVDQTPCISSESQLGDDDPGEVDPKKVCPCGSSTGEYKLDCSQCQQFWHLDCVGLKGLTKAQINKLVGYKCPFCYVAPVRTALDTADCCLSCRNTKVLRDANQAVETAQLAQNLQSLKALSVTLASVDYDSLNKNLQAMQELDSRLLHLLLKSEDLTAHQEHLQKVESTVNQISATLTSTRHCSTDSLVNEIIKLQDQVFTLSSNQSSSPTSGATPEALQSIENRLEKLCKNEADISCGISHVELKESISSLNAPGPQQPDMFALQPQPSIHSQPQAPEPLLNIEHGQKCISGSVREFIDPETATSLTTFFETCSFKEENGHAVVAFGEPYRYTGSRASANVPAIPEVIKSIVGNINDNFCRDLPQINSCLVNRYSGPESFLPQHSDDEATIHPESSIFTLSVGQPCTVLFAEGNSTDTIHEHRSDDRSLYSMTCKSQDFFQHRIDKGSVAEGVRYSLTFRSVDWRHKNSTIIVGDSNTGGLSFGSERGKSFGSGMPGRKVWAPHISDIEPLDCLAYSNVVVMCGINDIRSSKVKGGNDIRTLYHSLKLKVKSIKYLNNKANIFICPILPTKLHDLNRRAIFFNSLLREDLLSNLGVTLVDGFDGFLDEDILSRDLSKRLDKHGNIDNLHLNWKGTALLASLIKSAIFQKLNGGVDRRRRQTSQFNRPSRVDGESYRDRAARGLSGHP